MSHAKPRRGPKLLRVVGEGGGLGDVRVDEVLVGVGKLLVFVAHAEGQSQAVAELPFIGDESGVVGGLELEGGVADALLEIGVAGEAANAGCRARAMIWRVVVGGEV